MSLINLEEERHTATIEAKLSSANTISEALWNSKEIHKEQLEEGAQEILFLDISPFQQFLDDAIMEKTKFTRPYIYLPARHKERK